MITHIKEFKIPVLLVTLLFVFHLSSKDFSNPYERPIAGDAQAYHAYLPAIFIYQDLSYEFIPEINQKYYPESHQKSFLKPAGNGKVNKTFPGVTVLYTPFFLIAHALALISGQDADGYSTIYQVCFDIGLWVYLLLGLIFFIKVLVEMGFSKSTATLSAGILLLGTNLFFYSVYDQSVTHVYNFFMINLLIWLLLQFKKTQQFKYLGIGVFLLALIGITRPTNVLVFGLIFFFIPGLSFYKNLLGFIFKPKHLVRIILIGLPVIALPFVLWKLQTGNWVVYSYGDEGFDFAHPHYFEFIFSYLKGWLTYSPIILLILVLGFPLLFKRCKRRFVIALFFYLIAIYIFSSWWCWYYGAGMGQRVMIDHYILLGFLLALVIKAAQSSKIKKALVSTLAIGFIGLNTVQAYQIREGILTGGSATKQQYWDNFLVLEKKARVYPHEHWALEEEIAIDLSKDLIKGESYPVEGESVIQVTGYDNYSASVNLAVSNAREGSKLIIGFDARARHDIEETRAVYNLNGIQSTFMLSPYLKQDKWVKIEFMIEPKKALLSPLILFFWNGGSDEKVEIKNISVKNYFSESYL